MQRPPLHYARNAAGHHIAYWTIGEGPPDIVLLSNFVTNVDLLWIEERWAAWARALSDIGRVTAFDVAGTGASDPISADDLPTMERWAEDAMVTMDAVGIERATLLGHDAAGPIAAMFAASHPDRTDRLILASAFARQMAAPGYEFGYPEQFGEQGLEWWLKIWGTGRQLELTAPAYADDEKMREAYAVMERSTSMGMRRPLFEMIQQIDVRDVLPAIRVPTLVLHRADDRYTRVEHGRYLAEHIPDAKFVELPGDEHYMMLGDTQSFLDEVRVFLTGTRQAAPADRVLATMLFTDIVDSTKMAAAMGDGRWRAVLDRHDTIVREHLGRFNGREIKMTGDGCLATFDGPARAIQCALALSRSLAGMEIRTRCGLHTGEVELRGDDIGGIAVHIGARVLAEAEPEEVLVSASIPPLVAGSGLGFRPRGTRELKGVPGEWALFAVEN